LGLIHPEVGLTENERTGRIVLVLGIQKDPSEKGPQWRVYNREGRLPGGVVSEATSLLNVGWRGSGERARFVIKNEKRNEGPRKENHGRKRPGLFLSFYRYARKERVTFRKREKGRL